MFALVALIGLLTSAWGHQLEIPEVSLDERIVGGACIKIKQAPYQISLQYYPSGQHICGGVIISKRHALTAARCVLNDWRDTYQVRVGSAKRSKGGLVIRVADTIKHPRYYAFQYDIAVIVLSQTLNFNPIIQPVMLPGEEEEINDNELCMVSGWGATKSSCWFTKLSRAQVPEELRAVYVRTLKNEVCRKKYPGRYNDTTMICAGKAGRGACNGDYGNPLVIIRKLIGLVSWGNYCGASGKPDVYTSIPAMRKFIRETTGV